MSAFDAHALSDLASDFYAWRILQTHGDLGVNALFRLLSAIKTAHSAVVHELITHPLTVIAPFDEGTGPMLPGGQEVQPDDLPLYVRAGATLQPLGSRFLYWPASALNFPELAAVGIVYRFDGGDHFYVDGQLQRVSTQTSSIFGTPTYWSLGEALANYAIDMALESSCLILRGCWEDETRLIFENKPEDVMRKSLYQYLRSCLRGGLVDIRQEHNTDETNPVDIRVSWSLISRPAAIIEVKWVGDSRTASKKLLQYRDARAREGAEQLAEYLNKEKQSGPRQVLRGYLVVYDGRRRQHPNTRHYEKVEITYDPEYHKLRDDFEPPRRFYLEPAGVV